MLKLNSDLDGALSSFIRLLKQEEYFEAHEVLEEAWHYLRSIKSPVVNLVKGLINGAIAFEHIKQNRHNALKRAKRVIVSYDRYKGLYNQDIDSAFLFQEAMDSVEEIRVEFGV